jgi:Na+/H+ antiporter NhaD/arsenite permease-like protein
LFITLIAEKEFMYWLIAAIFVTGYLLIAFEHSIRIDKAATAILTAVLIWVVLVMGYDSDALYDLREHLGEISEILFFLLSAMTIVELVDAHDGFRIITDNIRSRSKVTLLWTISLVTFFLSAVLDNLTTTIVMLSLTRKLVSEQQERWFMAGMIVIAANAGGAWSPIGDVTTTMLWIGNNISALHIIKQVFFPSLICVLVPLAIVSFRLRGQSVAAAPVFNHDIKRSADAVTPFESKLVFFLGMATLLFVPVFKGITNLPPYMGILFGLGVLWVVTEILHGSKNAEIKLPLSIAGVLRRVDTPSILFFLGILMAVAALGSAGHLLQLGELLNAKLGNIFAINIAIGLLSAIIDNVPLVAGAMKMYPLVSPEQLAAATPEQAVWLGQFVTDGLFWEFLAYCAGTGGSCLIIGSAAGVAVMAMEKVNFFWYVRNISLLALLGYLAGAFVYIAEAKFIFG